MSDAIAIPPDRYFLVVDLEPRIKNKDDAADLARAILGQFESSVVRICVHKLPPKNQPEPKRHD